MSRYDRRLKAVNDSESYKKILKKRGRREIKQYRTPIYSPVSNEVLATTETYNYIFQPGDAYWKISNMVYGDPQYWYVIASFNRQPTLSHLRDGDIIRVPLDLYAAIEALG